MISPSFIAQVESTVTLMQCLGYPVHSVAEMSPISMKRNCLAFQWWSVRLQKVVNAL